MKKFLFFLLVAVFSAAESLDDAKFCDDRSWHKFQNSCYSFDYSSQNKRLSYYEAEDYCRSKGAHLASIHSEAEDKFILNIIEQRYYSGRMWIGLNILEGQTKYQWSDGSSVDYKNIVPKTQYQREKCFIYLRGKGGWRPEHCSLHYVPICKKPVNGVKPTLSPVSTTVSIEGNCQEGWLKFGGKCYKYFGADEAERKKYKEAKLACMALGEDYDLVSVHNMEEQAFLTQHLFDLGISAWIGFQKIPSDEIGHDLVFGWTDNSRTDFTYWAPGHPKSGTWKDCARLSYEGVGKGEWIGDYCEVDKKGYICQGPLVPGLSPPKIPSSKCDAKFVGYRDSCYRYFSEEKTWDEAEASCQEIGGHIVSISDSFEQAFLYNFIGKRSANVWNNLKTIKGTNIFNWSDNTPLYYTNFLYTPYGDYISSSTCVSMLPFSSLQWNATSCDSRLPYVCEISKSIVSPTPIPKPIIGQCPSKTLSWLDIGDQFCYHIGELKYDVLQWGTNSRYCISKGMEMISLHSAHQQNSLMAYLWKSSYDFWLAFIKSLDTKEYIWVDSTPVNYTNWGEREPNSWFSNECAVISPRDSRWYSAGCDQWKGNICRAKKSLNY